jgi:hypothetical protein
MSAIAFIVSPVSPKVAFISPVVFSAISTLLVKYMKFVSARTGVESNRNVYLSKMQRFDPRDRVFELLKNMEGTHPNNGLDRFKSQMLRCARDGDGCKGGRSNSERFNMKILGFLLMLSGWGISLAALALLSTMETRGVFIAAAIGVEILGLVLVIRSHPKPRGFES